MKLDKNKLKIKKKITEELRDFSCRLILFSYDFENLEKGKLNELLINFEALKSEFDKIAGDI